jgi:predicted GNAT family acetyltransferase
MDVTTEPNVEVSRNEAESRYEIHLDGELAGFAEYTDRPGRVVFTHTEIGDQFGGRGLAGRLIGWALDDVRARGLKLTPRCPFVRAYIDKHSEYADLVLG